jgi:hypothetical protein
MQQPPKEFDRAGGNTNVLNCIGIFGELPPFSPEIFDWMLG